MPPTGTPGSVPGMPTRRAPLIAALLCLAVTAASVGSTVAADAAAGGPGTEVYFGEPVDPGQYPFMVAILDRAEANRRSALHCGGSLISPDTVLTAAHCIYRGSTRLQPRDLDVLVGSVDLGRYDGARVQIRRIHVHPDYDPVTYENDVAILQLDDTGQAPVATVQPGEEALWAPATTATALGWGETETGRYASVLQQVDLPIVSDTDCATAYPATTFGAAFSGENMVCAGYTVDNQGDTCGGDSGGPMTVLDGTRRVLVGVTSWGSSPCSRGGRPGVYSRVAAFSAFIAPYLDPDESPGSVRRLRHNPVGAGRVRVAWNAPEFDGGTRIVRYRIDVPELGRVHFVEGAARSKLLRDLPPGTHRVLVRALNAVGAGPTRQRLVTS